MAENIRAAAEETIGFRTKRHRDWLDESRAGINEFIDKKTVLMMPTSVIQTHLTSKSILSDFQAPFRETFGRWRTSVGRGLLLRFRGTLTKTIHTIFIVQLKRAYGPQASRSLAPVRSDKAGNGSATHFYRAVPMCSEPKAPRSARHGWLTR